MARLGALPFRELTWDGRSSGKRVIPEIVFGTGTKGVLGLPDNGHVASQFPLAGDSARGVWYSSVHWFRVGVAI